MADEDNDQKNLSSLSNLHTHFASPDTPNIFEFSAIWPQSSIPIFSSILNDGKWEGTRSKLN